jgi:uncharacterized protein YjiS (DUF1127 family)
MSENDNSVPQLSFEIELQGRIKRILGTVRAFAEWLRSLVLRSTRSARRLASKRRIYSDIRELQQFDDRMLADIGVTTDRGAPFDGQIAAVNAQILSRANLLFLL